MRALGLLVLCSLAVAACDTIDPTATTPTTSFAKSPSTITITVVGPASGSNAYGVTDAGLVSGEIGSLLGPKRAFVWTPATTRGTTGTLRDLGTLGGSTAFARGANNASHVVGGSADAAGNNHPFLWTSIGGMKDLGLPPGAAGAYAIDINDAGHVVGFVDDRTARWNVAVRADGSVQVDSIEEMGTLPGGRNTVGWGINEIGQAVGWTIVSDINHPLLWTRDATGWLIEDLGVLPGHRSGSAQDVNDSGLVVGSTIPYQGCWSAVVWTTQGGRTTGMHALPTLGGCSAQAYGVNNQGDVVGRSQNQHGNMRPTLWSVAPDGSVLSVRDLGLPTATTDGEAYHVSARSNGVVQAAGFTRSTKTGELQATLWTVR